jgi:hypothetical protein
MKAGRAGKLVVWSAFLVLVVAGAFVIFENNSTALPVALPTAPIDLHARGPRGAIAPGLMVATAVSAHEVPQRLVLVQTSPGRSAHEGSALIGTDPPAAQRYRAGGILLNGARLVEIHNRYVILEREGIRLKLDLDSTSSNSGPPGAADLAIVGGAQPVTPAPVAATDYLSRLLRISPAFENEMLAGARLLPGTRPALFTRFGLVRGDMLIAVDGYPVMDASQLTAMLEPLSQGARMVFTVRRNSQPQDLVLDGAVIMREIESEAQAHSSIASPR